MPDVSGQNKWAEDLIWQASRSRELGHALCDCDGHYHTLWGTLRACGAVDSLQSEEPKFSPVISPFISDDCRLLVAGSADPGILCALGRVAGSRNPQFTIMDKCPAPLALIEEFAATNGISCERLHGNILGLDGIKTWDFIFVHYTHAFVDSSCHDRFFGALARSLAPGGTLACFTRTNAVAKAISYESFDRNWLARAYEAIRDSNLCSDYSDDKLQDMLLAYVNAGSVRRRNFLTVEDTARTLAATGLDVSVEEFAREGASATEKNVLRYASFGSSPVIMATAPSR